jgi:hypothetical protein
MSISLYSRSGGTDSIVNLWRIASCSSAPWIGAEEEGEEGEGGGFGVDTSDPPDVKVGMRNGVYMKNTIK